MSLVTDPDEVRAILADAAERGAALPAFCTEDERTTECILAGVLEKAEEMGVEDLPVIMSCTVNYPPRSQMKLYTFSGDSRLGLRAHFAHLQAMMCEVSPYRSLRVMPCLDHGFPWLDEHALTDYVSDFAMVMCDASERPIEENMKMTAAYVKRMGGRVVVEGCVDEIVESGGTSAACEITTVEDAERFVEMTGVDLVVANLGTEHRATAAEKVYNSQRAREISDAVGKILVLHGTSCLKPEELAGLRTDGIIKVNIYTILAQLGGQAVAAHVLRDLGNMFTEKELKSLAGEGLIGDACFEDEYVQRCCDGTLSAKLNNVAEAARRDVWVERVKKEIRFYLDQFGYDEYAKR